MFHTSEINCKKVNFFMRILRIRLKDHVSSFEELLLKDKFFRTYQENLPIFVSEIKLKY